MATSSNLRIIRAVTGLKRSVLYLDDETGCGEVFKLTFGEENDVRTATSLSEARRALRERAADIIISTQTLSEISGTDFLREVAASHPSSHRVLLTDTAHIGEVIHQIHAGTINGFIAKPWTEQSMRRALERTGAAFDVRSKTSQARALKTANNLRKQTIHNAA